MLYDHQFKLNLKLKKYMYFQPILDHFMDSAVAGSVLSQSELRHESQVRFFLLQLDFKPEPRIKAMRLQRKPTGGRHFAVFLGKNHSAQSEPVLLFCAESV